MSVRRVNIIAYVVALIMSFAMIQSVSASSLADWSGIETRIVKLFYPGQSSYQWLRSKEHKKAYNKVRKGEACISCHEEEEPDIGDLIVSGEKLEPNPIEGKPGSIDLLVQAAYDTENAYMRFQWKTANSAPGEAHTYWKFDGAEWQSFGGSRLSEDVRKGDEPAIQEDRLALMIDDGSVPMFAAQGCWLTCHDGMADMQKEARQTAIDGDPLLGAQLHATEVRKYLPGSRTDVRASWSNAKPTDELDELKASGGFVDLMQWRGSRSNSVDMADDGYILEYRHSDEGKSVSTKNWDDTRNQPRYMFDASKTGFKAKSAADLGDVTKEFALVPEMNAVAFDPKADWQKGDVVPKYVVSRTNASGSAADNQDVKAEWKDNMWTVEWTRKLNTGNPDDKVLIPGGAVVVGFAVHDDNISSRGHHVSFPLTLGFGVDGHVDISAVTLDAKAQVIAQ
jgi:hypothetical protein